ncbi:hypothetical protein AB0M28_31375 [Streptomyces sp. NPDC051940]|uniref:hypothetical protein n=1 Tax=Streptomyces sp. NPDC051940 TaxID=3155675 RepID=UPI0034333FE6
MAHTTRRPAPEAKAEHEPALDRLEARRDALQVPLRTRRTSRHRPQGWVDLPETRGNGHRPAGPDGHDPAPGVS